MFLASLGSGSKGNATVLQCGATRVLVDCGFSLTRVESRLQDLSLTGDQFDALLVTHEHSDHGSGVERLARKYNIPLFMTVGTARALDICEFHAISGGQAWMLGDTLQVMAVTVPHDAAEPVQFVFTDTDHQRRFGLLTDSGHVTSHMKQAYNDLHALLLEFNYDEDMLMNGAYPLSLKQRISGGFGHLSNSQSIDLLQQLDTGRLDHLIAGHLSENNNSPQLVSELLQQQTLACTPVLACQQQGFAWIEV